MSKSKKKGNKPADIKKNDVEKTDLEQTDAAENDTAGVSDTEEITDAVEDVNAEEEIVDAAADTDASDREAAIAKAEFQKLSFAEKCKKDPIIPVSILLAFVAIAVAVVYFMLPDAKAPSLGFNVTEFKDRYNNADIAVALYQNFLYIGFGEISYVDKTENPSILGEKETYLVSSSYVDYCRGFARNFTNSGMEGAVRKSDGNLAYIRVYSAADFEPAWMCFSNMLLALYPDLTKYQAMNIALSEVNEPLAEGQYTVRGDIAFKWYAVQRVEQQYFVVEAIPKSAVSKDKIGRVLDIAPVSDELTIPESNVNLTEETSAATT